MSECPRYWSKGGQEGEEASRAFLSSSFAFRRTHPSFYIDSTYKECFVLREGDFPCLCLSTRLSESSPSGLPHIVLSLLVSHATPAHKPTNPEIL